MKSSTTYSLQQIRDSGLLSDQRQAEVDAAVQARIQPAKLASGADLTDMRAVTLGEGKTSLFNVTSHSGAEDYMVRCILPHVLTPEEVNTIEKHCSSGRSTRRDAERFTKATKIPADEYSGYLYYGDEYFPDLDALLDAHDGDVDGHAWACNGSPVIASLRVSDIVENDISNNGWEDMDMHDLHGVKELQAACDAFVKANESVIAYNPDYTRAIILPKAEASE